jgi:hypothetical protein
MGERGRLTDSGPSTAAEALVARFVPPACSEEVVGDLHERYRSGWQYGFEALYTVPLVVISRIRRTADPQILLIQAFALAVSFLGAAWFRDGALLRSPWGLPRLAVPGAMALLGLVLEDAYAKPGRRTAAELVRGPVVGIGLAALSQAVLGGRVDLPRWVMLYGCGMSLLLCSAVRMLFPPGAGQVQGANAPPALWLKQAGQGGGDWECWPRLIHRGGLLLLAALAAIWIWRG